CSAQLADHLTKYTHLPRMSIARGCFRAINHSPNSGSEHLLIKCAASHESSQQIISRDTRELSGSLITFNIEALDLQAQLDRFAMSPRRDENDTFAVTKAGAGEQADSLAN